MTDEADIDETTAELLQLLVSSDARNRLRAAEELGDLLQYDAEHPASEILNSERRALLANRLIGAVVAESDSPEAREAMLNALCWGSSNDASVAWEHLLACLSDFDVQCLKHALSILGNTGNGAFQEIIERYLASVNPIIRSAAEDALVVLGLGGCQAG